MEKGGVGDLALILALLRASNNVIEGRTRLQKMVYLLKNSFDIPFGFEFRMYFYGPYSENLADTLQLLKAVELVEEEKVKIAEDVIQYNYEITDIGQQFLETYLSKSAKNQETYDRIRLGVQKMLNLPTSYLVLLSKKHYAGVEKAFYFFMSDRSDSFTGEYALSLREFGEKIRRVNLESLVFHLYRGDFEKWFSEVLGADKLAEEIKKLRQKHPSRDHLREMFCDIVLVKES